MNFILVGIGGIFGGLARFQLGIMITRKSTTAFPVGTFIINITGALLLGILNGLNIGNSAYVLLGDGFLGAYTTFSTFMYEGFNLFRGNDKLNAFTYILCSLLLGIFGYIAGIEIAKLLRLS